MQYIVRNNRSTTYSGKPRARAVKSNLIGLMFNGYLSLINSQIEISGVLIVAIYCFPDIIHLDTYFREQFISITKILYTFRLNINQSESFLLNTHGKHLLLGQDIVKIIKMATELNSKGRTHLFKNKGKDADVRPYQHFDIFVIN